PQKTGSLSMNGTNLLDIRDLRVSPRGMTETAILRGVTFSVAPGETLAVVGESGCGKSMASLAVMGLLPPGLERRSGDILFRGEPLPVDDNSAMRKVRGRRIGMVFQEPMAALNPVYTIGHQVAEVILEHEDISAAEARLRRSEEHTSELQSRENLVWRLLLENKKV